MTDRLGRDAEPVSSPGEYRLHVRRLVALFAGLGVLEIGILSGPTVYLTEGVNPMAAALLLAPIVVLAVVIAGVATGTIYLRRCGRPRRDLLRRADRLLAGLLAALLGVYVAVACVLAAVRVLPIAAPGDALARMHPLLGWYFVIAAAAAVVLTRRWRFTFVVALAPLLVMVNATAIGELQFVSVEDVMLDMATNLATIGALTWLLRLAEASDASGAQQRAQAVELAARQASTRAQHEANSFIHDHILSALIAVANGLPDRAARLTQRRDGSGQPGYCQHTAERRCPTGWRHGWRYPYRRRSHPRARDTVRGSTGDHRGHAGGRAQLTAPRR